MYGGRIPTEGLPAGPRCQVRQSNSSTSLEHYLLVRTAVICTQKATHWLWRRHLAHSASQDHDDSGLVPAASLGSAA